MVLELLTGGELFDRIVNKGSFSEKQAANVIKSILYLRRLFKLDNKKRLRGTFMERFILITQLKKEISIFKNDYKIAHSHSQPVDEMLKRLENKLKDDIGKLAKNISDIKGIDQNLDLLAKDQEETQTKMKGIINMQESISKYLIRLNNNTYNENLTKKLKQKEEEKNNKRESKSYKVMTQRTSGLNKEDIMAHSPRMPKHSILKSNKNLVVLNNDMRLSRKSTKSVGPFKEVSKSSRKSLAPGEDSKRLKTQLGPNSKSSFNKLSPSVGPRSVERRSDEHQENITFKNEETISNLKSSDISPTHKRDDIIQLMK